MILIDPKYECRHMRKNLKGPRTFSVIFLSVLPAACGGGSEGKNGPETLSPALTYPATVNVPWEKFVIPATVSGTSGQKQTCSVGASPLPEGVSLDPNSCDLTVDGGSPGPMSVAITLSVAGYSGSIGKYYDIEIDGPTLKYDAIHNNGAFDAIPWLKPLAADRGMPKLAKYTAVTGDVLTYKVYGKLPTGIYLDSVTGQLSGAAEDAIANNGYLYAELSRAGKSIKLRTNPFLTPTTPWAAYSGKVVTSADTLARAIPTIYRKDIADSYLFDVPKTFPSNSSKCNGFLTAKQLAVNEVLLEPITGAVRPVTNVPGKYCITLNMTTTRQGKTSPANEASVLFEIR
jgi:hypothetical protein